MFEFAKFDYVPDSFESEITASRSFKRTFPNAIHLTCHSMHSLTVVKAIIDGAVSSHRISNESIASFSFTINSFLALLFPKDVVNLR